jgi:myo-inositol-1(or 4)-monophosphatase
MWKKELDIANEAARAAGEILNRMLGKINHIMKKGDIDLVTEADLEAEKTILHIIRRNFPQDNILSEESGKHNETSDRTWLIDPLDGTTNFAHGFPFFAISIALEIEKQIVLGIVHNPYMDEHFEAVKGGRAYLNKKPIKVSKTRNLKESLLATGFPYDVHKNPQRVLEVFRKIIIRAQGVRRPGSAALDLCYVAAGRFDGFWEEGLKPWDTAAGVVIVNEAGGKLTTFEGEPYSPYMKSIVATNPFIHDAMIEVLQKT